MKEVFDNPTVRMDRGSITSALAAFRRTRQIPSYTHLRYICLGAGLPLGDWYLLSEDVLWKILSAEAGQVELRKQIKCYQGLLRSYWSFPAQTAEPGGNAYKGWLKLRKWLDSRFDQISHALAADPTTRTPQWFRVLEEHRCLLSEDPCSRYGASLLSGDNTLLQAAVDGLGIPTGSWVFDEAIFAQVRHSTEAKDSEFTQKLPLILNVVLAQEGKQISKSLATRCIASLVSRYAKCVSAPEHLRLRDASLEFIGNPWLRRAAWDAHVLKPNGKPDETAREMVHGWLRTRLIKDFFELLTEEKAADQRRLNYWLRFEPSIDDMWFVLGTSAFESAEKEFVDFRNRARGRILQLGGQTIPANNAFVMRMGDYAVIEFGQTGNACFVFAWNRLPKEVTKKLLSGIQRTEIDIATLRDENRLARLIHLDSPSSLISWEEKFDEQIPRVLNVAPTGPPHSLRKSRGASSNHKQGALRTSRPQQTVRWIPPAEQPSSPSTRPQQTVRRTPPADPPSSPSTWPLFSWTELERHVAKYRLKVADNRRAGGAYWVLTDNKQPKVANPLREWRFQYKPGKGWWRE
jgi:hypothetical protein